MLKINSKTIAGLLVAFMLVVAGSASALGTSTATIIKKGSSKANVMWLQEALNLTASAGLAVDGLYGRMTTAAIKSFQTSHPVSGKADGIAGRMTIAALNAAVAGGTNNNNGNGGCSAGQVYNPNTGALCNNNTNNPAPVTGTVTASLSASNPASNTLATGTASNPMLAINVSNGATTSISITGLNLTKAGYFSNTDISGVAVYDGSGVRHGNVVTTLGANGIATMTFATDPIVIASGQSTTLWVKVDFAGSSTPGAYAGGVIGFNVAKASDIVVTGTTVAGTFPIMGNQMSVVDGASSIGAVTLDELPVNAGGVSLNADANSEQDIAKFRVQSTNSNEDVQLYGLTLWNNGNASGTDYKDVQLLDQTGVVLATAQPNGQTITFSLATPYLITKGQTKDFWVKAKLINGASRTIQFVVYNNYDLMVKGTSTMAFLLPSAGTNDTSFPIGDSTSTYNKVTVASGSLVFSRATDSPATAVTPGANDVVLAKYLAKPVGENMELRGVTFGLDQDAGSYGLTGTVYVKVNGSVVYSAAANTTNFPIVGTASARTLSSYPILTAGVDNTIEITASVSSSATATDAYFVNDFDITSVKRLITNDITDPAVSVQDGFTRSVQAGALVTTTLATPVATSVVAGTNNVQFASFDLNASSSGEDVRVTAVTVTDTLSSSSYASVANLVMKDASGNVLTTSASTATNANTVTFTFSNPILVSRTGTTKINLFGDVISGATTGSHTYKIASGGVTATGQSTGNTITSSVAGSGQAMTITTSGSVVLSAVAGTGFTPSLAQLATVGQTDGIYLAGKFTSQYEAHKVTSLTLKATGTALVQNDLTNIRVYAQTGTGTLSAATVPFATASQFSSCSSNVCTYTWTSADNLLPMTIAPGAPVTIFVKADVQAAGVVKLADDFYMSMAQTPQLNTVTPVAANSTVYSHVINGTTVTYTSDGSATVAEITAGMTAAIDASSAINGYVDATDNTTTYTVVSRIPGLAFTSSTSGSAGTLADVATTANNGAALRGAVSNTYLVTASSTGSASGTSAHTYIVPQQVLVSADPTFVGGSTSAGVGTQLGRFKIMNNGNAQVTITHLTFTDSGSNSGTETYTVWASSQNSTDYTATAVDTNQSSVAFAAVTNFTIDGGAYRYVTVGLGTTVTGLASGDSWTLSVANLGDIKYSATEANLGYDADADGAQTSTIASIYTDGKPSTATVSKL